MNDVPRDDRRDAIRVPAGHARAILFEIEEDGIMVPGALAPHDLSIAGVRGKWERALPLGVFRLRLEIASDIIETNARAAWQRPLPGRNVLAGISFLHLDDDARARLESFLQALQTPTRRRSPRFADVLPVELISGDQSLTAIASDVSVAGMQITTDEGLPTADEITLLIPLTWDVPLEVEAVIRWRRTTPHGGLLAGIELTKMSEGARESLDAYLRDLTE